MFKKLLFNVKGYSSESVKKTLYMLAEEKYENRLGAVKLLNDKLNKDGIVFSTNEKTVSVDVKGIMIPMTLVCKD